MLVGRKMSGKTAIINNYVNYRLPKKAALIIICPSLDTDHGWQQIIARAKKRGNPVYEYYNIIDPNTRENNLQSIMQHMEKLNRKDPDHKKKLKNKEIKYMLIIDDCCKAMRHPSMYQFLCKNRHEGCAVVLSGQSMKSIQPDVRQQIGLWYLFPQLNDKDLTSIYEDSDPPISEDKFKSMYNFATSKQWSFFNFTPKGDFRINFTEKYPAPKIHIKNASKAKIAKNEVNAVRSTPVFPVECPSTL